MHFPIISLKTMKRLKKVTGKHEKSIPSIHTVSTICSSRLLSLNSYSSFESTELTEPKFKHPSDCAASVEKDMLKGEKRSVWNMAQKIPKSENWAVHRDILTQEKESGKWSYSGGQEGYTVNVDKCSSEFFTISWRTNSTLPNLLTTYIWQILKSWMVTNLFFVSSPSLINHEFYQDISRTVNARRQKKVMTIYKKESNKLFETEERNI